MHIVWFVTVMFSSDCKLVYSFSRLRHKGRVSDGIGIAGWNPFWERTAARDRAKYEIWKPKEVHCPLKSFWLNQNPTNGSDERAQNKSTLEKNGLHLSMHPSWTLIRNVNFPDFTWKIEIRRLEKSWGHKNLKCLRLCRRVIEGV